MAIGCGPRKIEKDVKNAPPEQRTLLTAAGKTTKRQFVEKTKKLGPVQWEVEWKSAKLDYLTENDYSGRMEDVKGTIYEKGKPAGTFRADGAEAFKQSNRLTLSGHVVLTSLKVAKPLGLAGGDSTLSCDKLIWDAGEEVVKAEQNVNLNTLDYRMGPIPKVWATPTLDVVATPELFKKLDEGGKSKIMDMKTFKVSVALALAAAGAVAPRQAWSFQDQIGNMKVDGIGPQKTSTDAAGNLRFAFSGNPLVATWQTQRLTVECKLLTGFAEKAGKGKYKLAKANMSGKVKAILQSESTNARSAELQTVTATGDEATYDAKTGILTLTGGVVIDGNDPGAGTTTQLKGSSATVSLGEPDDPAGKGGIVGAKLTGPADIVIDSKETLKSGEVQKTHAVGGGNELNYKSAGGEGVVTITGNATFDVTQSVSTDGVENLPKGGKVHLSGSSAVVKLALKKVEGESVLRSATVEGPVNFAFDGHNKEKDVEILKTHTEGKADGLDFRALGPSERKKTEPTVWSVLTLTGGVEVTSKPTGYNALASGKITGYKKFVIEFDASGKPLNTEGEGNPGTATFELNPPAKKADKGAGK